MKRAFLGCFEVQRQGYLHPNRILSLDLRELILNSRSVQGVYRKLSMNSYGTKKDELIDEIFRSSSTLTGVEDRNRLLMMDCVMRKDSGNHEENQKI